jgi:hypothetical protein
MKLTALVFAILLPVVCFAASPTIGVVNSGASAETSLVDGSALETKGIPSDVRLDNGVALLLAARSAGTIYGDHAILEHGAARFSNFGGYQVQVGQLIIESDTPQTEAVVRLQKKTIEIASIGGAVKVTDGGAMLTRVAAGSKMAFQNSGAAPAQTGAAPAKKPRSDTKTFLWVIVAISAAALAIGLTAAAEGKSPF